MIDLNKIKKKNICIMGLMGSGKSIIGKDLSKYSNLKFKYLLKSFPIIDFPEPIRPIIQIFFFLIATKSNILLLFLILDKILLELEKT